MNYVIWIAIIYLILIAGAWYFDLLPISPEEVFPQVVESALPAPTERAEDQVDTLVDENETIFIDDDSIPDYNGDSLS